MALTESKEQQAVVQWWRIQHPKFARSLIASANGAVLAGDQIQRARQMARLKAMGLVVGASDLFLAIPMGPYAGLWLEMKSMTGTASEEQKTFHADMKANGYQVAVARGATEAIQIISDYMKQQKEAA